MAYPGLLYSPIGNGRYREGTMEYRFNADEWKTLTKTEQVRRCRLMATQARALAENGGSPDLIRSYLRIADDWDRLADEVERSR